MFTKLVVPLDRSPLAEQAVGRAAAIARALNAEVDLVLVQQAFPFAGLSDAPWNTDQHENGDQYLETIAAELVSGASVHATHAVVRGETVDMICAHAHDIDADLIVMTSHGRTGLSRAWLGSVADGVIRKSSIPVLMLRPAEGKTDRRVAHESFKRLLVPLDGSGFAADILSSAMTLARANGAHITLLRVVQTVPLINVEAGLPFVYPPTIPDHAFTKRLVDEAKQQLDELADRLAEEGRVAVDAKVVLADHVAQGILDFARGHGVDLIAMSTHGRGTSRVLLGSVADKVLRGSDLPMLLYHPAGLIAEGADASAPLSLGQPTLLANA